MAVRGFSYSGQTILSHPVFVETILPFLLVFTLVFAVLQKSKILGDGKKQIDAIVALVVGLLVISFGNATGVIVQLVPFLAVSMVVILVFMLLVGTFQEKLKIPDGVNYAIIAVAVIAVTIAVVYITNFWQTLYDLFFVYGDSNLLVNIIFIAIIIGVMILLIVTSGKSSGGKP